MDKHKFKVGDVVKCSELDNEEWVIILIRDDGGCTIACNTSTRGWDISRRNMLSTSKYIGYRGWNTYSNDLTLVRKANPIWIGGK